jgi:ribosomal protein S18 acetylase RimI-like enzyme
MTFSIQPLPAYGPLFEGAIAVYGEAFAQPPYSDPDRGSDVRSRIRDVHSARQGYRAFVATLPGGSVAGMIYGYHGTAGQWWHDTVVRALPAEVAREWLVDSYELVEVAVRPGCQGAGIGRALITELLNGRAEATCVLSTRTDSRAHHLYSRLGFATIIEMQFASNGAPFYVMGRPLPCNDLPAG